MSKDSKMTIVEALAYLHEHSAAFCFRQDALISKTRVEVRAIVNRQRIALVELLDEFATRRHLERAFVCVVERFKVLIETAGESHVRIETRTRSAESSLDDADVAFLSL